MPEGVLRIDPERACGQARFAASGSARPARLAPASSRNRSRATRRAASGSFADRPPASAVVGEVGDIEIVAREVADHRSEHGRGAKLVVARIGEREFGGIAHGARLQGIILDRAAGALQLVEGVDIAAEAIEICLGFPHRARGAHQIEVGHRDIEDNLRAGRGDAEPRGLGGVVCGAHP